MQAKLGAIIVVGVLSLITTHATSNFHKIIVHPPHILVQNVSTDVQAPVDLIQRPSKANTHIKLIGPTGIKYSSKKACTLIASPAI